MVEQPTTTLRTPVCDILGCDYPVVLAGMGGVARSELVIAVIEAGAYGFLGMVREPPDLIRAEIRRVRSATSRNFGVNVIPAATAPDLLAAQIEVLVEEQVAVVALFWDLHANIVKRLTDAGRLVVCQVGSANEAELAVAAGARVVVAQGFEAGGHVRGRTRLMTLVPQVAERVTVPILAAGAIVNGTDLASAITVGAQGALIGTAFLATRESFAHQYHKDRIVASEVGDTVHTEAFHINWPKGASVRVLSNSVTRGEYSAPPTGALRIIGEEAGRPIYLFSTDSPLRNMTGNFEAMALYAGEGAGRISSIPTAAGLVASIVDEATRVLEHRIANQKITATDPPPRSSN